MAYDPRTARYLCFGEARDAFAAGQDGPRAYLERCLERIASSSPASRRSSASISTARATRPIARTSAGAQGGRVAVDGLPIGVKDCYDVAGLPTEVGSRLFKDNVAAIDAAHVDALRRGGAIIVGKTATTELTMALPAPTMIRGT